MRMVFRQGTNMDTANMILADIRLAVEEFEKLQFPTQSRLAVEANNHPKRKRFTHIGGKKQ